MPMRRGYRGHYGHRRRGLPLATVLGRGLSKGGAKCFVIGGAALLIAGIVLIVVGVLCIVGVFKGNVRFIGTPLLSIGMGLVMTSIILLMVACQSAMQQNKAAPAAHTYGHGAGQSTNYPSAFAATPVQPPPFQSPAPSPQPPPPYGWTSPAPFGGAAAPASSVQGPYSGFNYTSSPNSGTGNSIPAVSS